MRFAARGDAPDPPRGDLVQAGPLLVTDGEISFDPADDREGFSAGAGQFDSDITDGRHPRAALGVSARESSPSPATGGAPASTPGCRCWSSP